MKTKTGFYVILFLTFLFFQSCSEETPTQPDNNDDNNTTLVTATIGSEGGSIGTDDVTITIPSGAFQSNADLKLLKSGEENSFDNNAISDVFIIDGLPLDFNKPIDVKIKYNGTITDSAYIAFGEDVFVKSLNTNKTCYRLLSARDSSGYLVSTIPAINDGKLAKTTAPVSGKEDKVAYSIGAICGYGTYISSQGHFRIYFPTSVLTQTYDLGDYLEAAYSKFLSIGFSYSQRTRWPIDVTVKRLKSGVFGYTTNSAWGDNYGYMEFNLDKMGDAADMMVTAGHEFFHLIQAFYDNRNRYFKAVSKGPNYWLDEASSVWSEEFFSGSGSGYVSDVFSSNSMEILKGAKTCDASEAEIEAYGYGMAGYIKYFTKKQGDNTLVKVYERLYNNETPFEALNNELPLNLSYSWHSFLKDYFTFSLYKGKSFTPTILLSKARELNQKFEIKSADDTAKTYNVKLSDLSATIFSVKNLFDGLSDNTQLQFICKDTDIQVYKVNSRESVFLANASDTLFIEDFKEMSDNGYQLVALIYNDDCSSPYTDEKELEFKIRVVTPVTISFVSINVDCKGFFEIIENGVTSYSNASTSAGIPVNMLDPQIVSVSGNTISCAANFSDPYIPERKYNYSATILLDNIAAPSMIKEFSFNYSAIYTSGSVSEVTETSATGENIPYSSDLDNSLWFRLEGDITNNLSNYSSKYSQSGGTLNWQKTLLSFDASDGGIVIVLKK